MFPIQYTMHGLTVYFTQALEPHISGEIMTIHHDKHHQAYVNNLNAAEEAYAKLDPLDIEEKIRLSSSIKFNGGGT
jgi:Fe-Mn family superoxide dismutase